MSRSPHSRCAIETSNSALRGTGSPSRLALIASLTVLLVAGVACGSSADAATSPEQSTTSSLPIDEGRFEDPQGTYSLEIHPDWQANHGTIAAETELWYVASPDDKFGPNLNVLTQVAPGMNTESYLELSVENAPAFLDDFELVSEEIVEGSNGRTLGSMEYTGDDLQFLGVFAVGGDKAVVATLTAPPDRFEAIRDEVMPYLLTLELSGTI